jgi:hypothetical protein
MTWSMLAWVLAKMLQLQEFSGTRLADPEQYAKTRMYSIDKW